MSNIQIYLPEGKAAVQKLTWELTDAIINGENDPIQIEVQLKAMEEVLKAVRKNDGVRHAVLNQLSMYKEKTIEMYNAKITKKLTPAQYDYSACNDPKWNELNEQLTDLKERLKERETFLKAITHSMPMIDDETGEMYIVEPPVKTQGETIAITLI